MKLSCHSGPLLHRTVPFSLVQPMFFWWGIQKQWVAKQFDRELLTSTEYSLTDMISSTKYRLLATVTST